MARVRKAKYEATAVEAVVHRGETRVNIPTAELADFAVKEVQAPYTLRWPRDPSLDPQLVWKGKDEQDGRELEVPAVPIYIQEHIQPKAIIEELRRAQREGTERQASLFEVFDGMELGERVEFYRHAQSWSNRMILGDSLLAMTSLAEKEGLKGRVQMTYLDPPYGIRFGSNWQVSTRRRDVRDGRAEDATREPEQIRAFRDTWKLGIHSYLSYLRDRLVVARELLTETGSIFVQIGDENVHLVRCVLAEDDWTRQTLSTTERVREREEEERTEEEIMERERREREEDERIEEERIEDERIEEERIEEERMEEERMERERREREREEDEREEREKREKRKREEDEREEREKREKRKREEREREEREEEERRERERERRGRERERILVCP